MKLVPAMIAAIGSLALFSACTSNTKAPTATSTTPAEQVESEPALDYNRTSYQGQLMTDYQVGKVLGEIKCGKRPVRDGIDYLNVNGVPPALLETQTPEVVQGFQSATTWC